jgi:K+/H+ antiporter YhaU regulatory subunit KhtT
VKPLQLGLSLIPVAIIVIGLIGWVVTLRGNIDAAMESIQALQESQYDDTDLVERVQELDIEMAESVADVVTRQAVVENEMRQIMSDHEGFADVLYELGESGLIERREYGNYK